MNAHLSTSKIIPTGSLRLDFALGSGGLPPGCYTELRGPESSGKTSLCLHTIAEAQKLGGVCAIIDSDHAITLDYAIQCGIDPQRLYISQPNTAEQALNILETIAHCGSFTLIVLDSISTLVPQEDFKLPLWTSSSTTHHQLLSYTLNKLANIKSRFETRIIFTNQNPPQLSSIYHNLSRNLARLALGMQSDLRLNLQPGKILYQKNKMIGRKIQIKISKNALSPHFYSARFEIIMYNKGLDKSGEIVSLGIQLQIIKKKNAGWIYQGQNLGSYSPDAARFLEFIKAQRNSTFFLPDVDEQEFDN